MSLDFAFKFYALLHSTKMWDTQTNCFWLHRVLDGMQGLLYYDGSFRDKQSVEFYIYVYIVILP